MDEARLRLRTNQRDRLVPSEICGFLKEELEDAAICRASGQAISQSIEPRSCASSDAAVLLRSDDPVARYAVSLSSF
jgi:hypothetical protein